jgi:hypothetical protein
VLVLIIDVSALSAKHLLRLVERLVGCAHCLIKGDASWGSEERVPMDDLGLLHNVITNNCRGEGRTNR